MLKENQVDGNWNTVFPTPGQQGLGVVLNVKLEKKEFQNIFMKKIKPPQPSESSPTHQHSLSVEKSDGAAYSVIYIQQLRHKH